MRAEGVLQAATVGALVSLAPVVAKQVGWLDHLPDPAGSLWDSDGITGSKAAHPLGIPDGLLGVGSYSVTLALAILACRDDRARKLLGWKLAADGAAAGFNVVRQVVTFRKMCSWCMATAVCTAAMVVAGRKMLKS